MTEETKKKYFVLLQFCALLTACTLLPDFGSMTSSMLSSAMSSFVPGMSSSGSSLSNIVLFCRLAGIVGTAWAFFNIYHDLKEQLPMSYVCITAGSLLFALYATFDDSWVQYIALIGMFVTLYMSKNALGMEWKQDSSQGAYIILLAILLHVYYNIDGKISTSIAAFVGLIMYLFALGRFSQSLDDEGQSGAGKLKIAVWIGIVATALKTLTGWIPLIGAVVGIFAGLLNVVAFVFEFMGYGNLRHSESLHDEGQKGARVLRISMLLTIVSAIFVLVPFIGDTVAGIISIVALWFVFKGWNHILEGMENVNNEETLS